MCLHCNPAFLCSLVFCCLFTRANKIRKRLHKSQRETSSFLPGLSSTFSLFTCLLLPLDAISFPSSLKMYSLAVHWSLVTSWHDLFLTWFELYLPFHVAAWSLHCSVPCSVKAGRSIRVSIWACSRYWLWIWLDVRTYIPTLPALCLLLLGTDLCCHLQMVSMRY